MVTQHNKHLTHLIGMAMKFLLFLRLRMVLLQIVLYCRILSGSYLLILLMPTVMEY